MTTEEGVGGGGGGNADEMCEKSEIRRLHCGYCLQSVLAVSPWQRKKIGKLVVFTVAVASNQF